MFQIYFCISMVILSVALSVGLISGFAITPIEATEEILFLSVGKIAGGTAGIIILIIYFLEKTGLIKITEELIENR